MSKKNLMIFWIVTISLLFIFISLVSNILLPFVVALIAAYFLDPAADKLEEIGLSRTLATLTITMIFFWTIVLVGFLVVPLLYEEIIKFVQKVPEYVKIFNEKILPEFSKLLEKLDPESIENAKNSVSSISGYIFSFIGKAIGGVWNSGIAVINIFSLLFITPVVTFYMLRDWDKMMAKLENYLPPAYKPTILDQLKKIDITLSGYIRGQTNVCIILGLYYSIALSFKGLDFAIFIGFGTGLLSFIPYVGIIFGFIAGMLVAFFQYGDWLNIAIVAAIFVSGQVIEGTFVTPKLVGDKVGLHPVWIIFGMLCGATLFGFVGILLAIPVTAVIGVLWRFGLERYLESKIYNVE